MLRFLFYTEFDDDIGTQLPIAVPRPFCSQEELDELTGYLNPKESLSGRLISFPWKSNIIINFPVRIKDEKAYPGRGVFYFSFGMVLRKPPDAVYDNERDDSPQPEEFGGKHNASSIDDKKIEIESYERILKRMTLIFLSLENDFKFLSKSKKTPSDHYPAHFKFLHDLKDPRHSDPEISGISSTSKPRKDHEYLLRTILMKIFNGFSRSGECTVNLLDSRKMALKLYNKLAFPQRVRWHDVPVLINDLKGTDNRWDIALQFVLKQINSVNHVQRICDILGHRLLDVDTESIRECIKQLLYYKYVAITDIFKYNNYYVATKNVQHFLDSVEMQRTALAFVSREDRDYTMNAMGGVIEENDENGSADEGDGYDGGEGLVDDEAQRMVHHLKRMYAEFSGNVTVKELMEEWKWKEHAVLKRVHIHKFVLFGTVNKLIRRIHRYPIIVQDPPSSVKSTFDDVTKRLVALCDGAHCFDEICCELGRNQRNVKRLLNRSGIKHVVLRK